MRAAVLRLIAIPFALSFLMAVPVSAETALEAVVCTGDSQPTLSLLPDINDSTLRVNRVEINGVVERVSAVEVYVNSEYDHTIAIPANETAFATSVRLPIGTHTLRIEAVGICSGNNATREAVVTIIPWNYGFVVPTNNSGDETAQPPRSGESSGEALDQVASSNSAEQRAAGLLGILQALFPESSPKEVILATVLLASTTLTLLPSSVLTQAAAGQVIAGRRMLFIGLLPAMGFFCLTLSS